MNGTSKPALRQLSDLIKHLKCKRFNEAEETARSILKDFPNNQIAWKALWVAQQNTKKTSESLDAVQRYVKLAPKDPKAHYYLGITLKALGRFEESEISLKTAIEYKPDYYKAHFNLGVSLHKLGKLREACSAFNQAICLNSECLKALRNIGFLIMKLRFTSSEPELYPVLINLLKKNIIRPRDLAPSISTLLRHDPLISSLLVEKNIIHSVKKVTGVIKSLNRLKLLHHLMRTCPLPDLQLEGLFMKLRSFLLKNNDKLEASPELEYFLSTLSLHCFTNEYIYYESEEECQLVTKLEAIISEASTNSKQPKILSILCLASYRPLHKFDWCKKIKILNHLDEIKKRLIEEPLLEKTISRNIVAIEETSDKVSKKVRVQYEENPYPRWVKLALYTSGKSIDKVFNKNKFQLYSETIKDITSPKILIAGCGTGQHAIETASRFSECHVTAVDLSLASLAYAIRKTNEHKLTNIDYFQADILKLNHLGKEFDIVESSGVLHHMYDPLAGWRMLTNLLKYGGLMKIGLYSELARQDIVEIRKKTEKIREKISTDDMKKFRQSVIKSPIGLYKQLAKSQDFFSLSDFRDLIFHVQEHRFTLPQIERCLKELGLKFCGFENEDIISSFRSLHGKYANKYDLELWHQYEKNTPKAFGGMYQFWCQKI